MRRQFSLVAGSTTGLARDNACADRYDLLQPSWCAAIDLGVSFWEALVGAQPDERRLYF